MLRQAIPFACALVVVAPAAADEPAGPFAKVAAVLQQRCVSCHHQGKAKGELDLSTRAGLLKGGEQGAAAMPGRAGESLLIRLVKGAKPRMPKGEDPLDSGQVADLKAWIDAGAPWPDGVTLKPQRKRPTLDWWSLKPVVRPAVPGVKNAAWVRTPIDAFILSKLEAAGLAPSPEAEPEALIRRLTFDLHGLPPTPSEIVAFVRPYIANPEAAYEKLVERLLASPRYGERWGRHWLDVAHYADTHGYDKDKRRDNAWRYRDYVIAAFNADKPYSRFVREQLAGDVLFPGDRDALIATGFIAAGPWDFVGHVELREGTVDKEKTRTLDRDDMISNTIGTFASVTVHCARCHDHMFDPVPQADYYRLAAVFAGVQRADRELDPAAAAQRADLERRRAALAAALPGRNRGPSPSNGWHSGIEKSPDVVKWVQVDLGTQVTLNAIRLVPARPTDFIDTPGFGFPLRFKVEISDDPTFAKRETLADHSAADFANPGDKPVDIAVAGKTARYVRVTAEKLWKRTNDYVFALAELEVYDGGRNVAIGANVTSLDSIEAGRWGRRRLVDGFDSRNAIDLFSVSASPARARAELAVIQAELAELDAKIAALPAPARVYAPVPMPPRPIRLLHRGDVEQPREPASPGALSMVTGIDCDFKVPDNAPEGVRRAALAEWLVNPANPLTRRSIVNRIWHYHFGRGIVDSPNDFGRNGGKPSHPELLDWLADEFVRKGESIKELHRLIVTSAVYRQSSAANATGTLADADNRLLWRMNRTRLDAEAVRDAVLAVSGKLDLTMGGPGYEPFRFKDDHSPIYDHGDVARINDPKTWRRSVYRFTVRSVPNPFLECLDCADPNISVPVRNTTITALQALALLNNPFMVRQSELFAERLDVGGGDASLHIDSAYLLAFGRRPTNAERDALTAYAAKHGMPAACRLLFNANEFVFVD